MNNTNLTIKHILITTISFIIIPILSYFGNLLIDNYLISLAFFINLVGIIIIMKNFRLIEIHLQRFKQNLAENILFTIIGAIFISLFVFIRYYFLPSGTLQEGLIHTMRNYSFFIPMIFLTFCIVFPIIYVCTFKNISDRLIIKNNEILRMVISAILMALLFTIFYIPLNNLATAFFLGVILLISLIIAYQYNQTCSIISSIFSLLIAIFIYLIVLIL